MNEIKITISKADNGWIVSGNNHVKVARDGFYDLESIMREIIRDWDEAKKEGEND
jgi:hypothetical protein